MRLPEVLLLAASLALSGCVDTLRSQQPPAKWTTGFWLWGGGVEETPSTTQMLDVLYIHAGTIVKSTIFYVNQQPWSVFGTLPKQLPEAREYWIVFRYEHQAVPDLSSALILSKEVSRLREQARQRHINVAGVQLDIDSPTGALSQYAKYLHEVKQDLQPGLQVSITGLLDWFRNGTAIADVIKEVDEFVPQFYDVANPQNGDAAIAARFDAAQWGPVFNRFGKRFRIGISTFGRARLVPGSTLSSQSGYSGIEFFRGVTPLDIATLPGFTFQASRNEANELVLNYRATRKTSVGYNDFSAGDTIQFILSTPDAVRTAVANAKKMGGNVAGVVFFRWPTSYETLAMQPDEVLNAAGIATQSRDQSTAIDLIDGGCVAVTCVDVYLMNAGPLSAKPMRYSIRSSEELQYFLPEEKIPVRMLNPSELELSLPAYCGRGRMYLGRAVTAKTAEFSISENQ